MSRRTHRFLTLWFFVALQMLAPFIHAHAGAVSLHHGDILHLHPSAPHADAVWHAAVSGEHGAEVSVATGLPARSALSAGPADAPLALPRGLPRVAAAPDAGQIRPAPPPVRPDRLSHTRPPAVAPPRA